MSYCIGTLQSWNGESEEIVLQTCSEDW